MLLLKFRAIRLYRKSIFMTTLFNATKPKNMLKHLCFTDKTNHVSKVEAFMDNIDQESTQDRTEDNLKSLS